MLVYKDAISEDELFTDAFVITGKTEKTAKTEEVDPFIYEVDCKMITVGPTEVNTGANASAEDAEEALEDGSSLVNNVIYSNRLQESSKFDKKSYMVYIKGYLKAIDARLKKLAEAKNNDPESKEFKRSQSFQKDAQAFVLKVVKNIGDYDFYTGESMNPDGMIVLLNYRADGITPYLSFFRDGLTEMKV
ncbi:hypothetical protein GGI21_002946 [Coemansia aciculifera]|uniref:Uncharacterized protein n=1 Tax=Coemansia aciculifera TaxID=417176 RepID=A0ACC1M6U2_9FUNG|nr:hypothetical protein IWW38_001235 [Coemansia aciculifera]KAJ2908378.1 hypothetical protein GGI21_002946 [Coemansia aciculifera]